MGEDSRRECERISAHQSNILSRLQTLEEKLVGRLPSVSKSGNEAIRNGRSENDQARRQLPVETGGTNTFRNIATGISFDPTPQTCESKGRARDGDRSRGRCKAFHSGLAEQLISRQLELLSMVQALEDKIKLKLENIPGGAVISSIFPPEDQHPQPLPHPPNSSSSDAPVISTSGLSASIVQTRLEKELVASGCKSFKFVRVPSDYYSRTYEERRALLGAASVEHLCKSIVMVNTQAEQHVQDCRDPCNSKYYVIVVQYAARLNADKVRNFVYLLNGGRIPKKRFNMRLAPEAESDSLTGFEHNAVTPVGMRTEIPVILSDAVTKLEPPFFWLGGGEVDLKLGIDIAEFTASVKPFVTDCTY